MGRWFERPIRIPPVPGHLCYLPNGYPGTLRW